MVEEGGGERGRGKKREGRGKREEEGQEDGRRGTDSESGVPRQEEPGGSESGEDKGG